MTSVPQKLNALGQSIWYDNIERRLLENGDLEGMITRGDIYGVTSNPSIFNKAIGESEDYDQQLAELAREGRKTFEIFDEMAVQDIQAACDLFQPLYESTEGADGYVSIEVHPDLANDTSGTSKEAVRLWTKVNRPNLMIKIPATEAGIPAIQQSLASGLNVNITLIFACQRYAEVIDAYMAGLEHRVANGLPIAHQASVASFFVSRIDVKIDGWLDEIVKQGGAKAEQAQALKGKIAVANAKLAYELFQKEFATPRFAALQEKGARLQRPLWASTSTKNPDYPDLLYVDTLVGQHTVNTVPPQTLEAVKDHGQAELTVEHDVDQAHKDIAALEELGLSLDKATDELEAEGVESFSQAIHTLFHTIDQRSHSLVS